MDDTSLLADLNAAAEAIWLAAAPTWPTLSLEVRPALGSTNTELMARGRQGDTAPVALVTAQQTAGRGRQGRNWLAEPGRSLTFSLGLPLPLDTVPGGGSTLSLVVGVALVQALQGWRMATQRVPGDVHEPADPRLGLGLKWPNDLLWQGRKLAGILIEATPAPGLAPGERWVVVGVGLNLQPPQAEVQRGFAAVSELPGPQAADTLTPGAAWAALVPPLLSAIDRWAREGFAPWQATYARHDVLAGQAVTLLSPGQDILGSGTAQGVGTDGALLVHTAQGVVRWTSGEVSVRAVGQPDWRPRP